MKNKLLSSVVIAILCFSAWAIPAMAAPFDTDTPHQQAVPNFLDTIISAFSSVKDEDELNDIDTWEQDNRERLPEFLDDLLTIAQQLETQGSPEFIFEEYGAFADKWNQLSGTYPGLNELDPILSPITDQLLAGLPQLQTPSSQNPLGGFYDLYKVLEAEDPWGFGGLFIVEPLPDSLKEIRISEILDEQKKGGVKARTIAFRETVATQDGAVVFFELIQEGQIIQRFVNFRDPSIIHETLNKMKQNNEDPMVIAALEDLVGVIDLNIQSAFDAGILDACSYNFIYRKSFGNVLKDCTDVASQVQNFTSMSRFDPFDDVNQVKLSEAKEFVSGLPNVGLLVDPNANAIPLNPPLATQPILEEYNKGFQAPAQVYMIGILVPAYLLSVLGFFRGI